MIRLTILGSTGSIGQATLSVVKKHPKQFKIIALVAQKNIQLMFQQCLEFKPQYAAMSDPIAANQLKQLLNQEESKIKILSGCKEICELSSLDNVDQVMSAISGIAGLLPTLSAVYKGKRILLANKETLITSGKLFFNAIKKYNAQVIPIDSEHNAIFQNLSTKMQLNLGFMKLKEEGITQLILTGSGGPFRTTPLSYFHKITPNQACKHPVWSMGRKISVDSATMMNKGFEYIEARYFFNAIAKEIKIIIHPQSIIHSMIHYCDGSTIAQLGIPDMRIPISYGMGYPQRIISGVQKIDLKQLSSLTFLNPDYKRYPCLKLAIDTYQMGQAATTILNAANEISVEAFLSKKIKFTDIAIINSNIIEKSNLTEPKDINDIIDIDDETRKKTIEYINKSLKIN